MPSMRINKYLSQNGYCSRREADRLVEQGRVFVNNKQARLGDQVGDQDVVRVEGRDRKRAIENIYVLLNKPVGVTTDAREENNVIGFVGHPERISSVGRLDARSSGLLLLTNDSTLASRLVNPKYEHEEEYVVGVDCELSKLDLGKLQSGVSLDNERAQGAKVRQLSPTRFAIVLRNVRDHQVRGMCEALRYNVVELKRARIGPIKIPMSYPVGNSRNLTRNEVRALKKSVGMD
jgi:pseudouridine synthase